ncbi:radical SAM/SPASM domain-containing protein [Lachnospiraceae bacterium JLR.KK008]
MELYYNLGISVGLACNMRHNFCYQSSFHHARISDEILYDKLADFYGRSNYISVLGGELTVIEGMKEYLRYLRSRNDRAIISIVTNGSRFDEEWLRLCIDHRISVNFSLDASSEEAYGKLMASGSNPYKSVKANYDRALQAYHEEGFLLNCISMVVTDDSVDDMIPFVKGAVSDGVNCQILFTNNACVETTDRVREAVYRAVKLKKFCEDYIDIRVLNLSDDYTVNSLFNMADLAVSPLLEQEKQEFLSEIEPKRKQRAYDEWSYFGVNDALSMCTLPWNGIYVMHNGDVMPCCCMSHYICGNLYQQSMEEILDSEYFHKIREAVEKQDYSYCWSRCRLTMRPANLCIAGGFWEDAQKLFECGNYAGYVDWAESLSAPDRLDAKMTYWLAFACHMQNYLEKAVSYYTSALEKGFDPFWVKYNRADVYLRLGGVFLDQAREDIRAAYALNPQHEGIQEMYETWIE